jgi:hypothetical protein
MSKTSVSISPVLKQRARAPEVGDRKKKDYGKLGGFWLIPTHPFRELVRVFAIGASKYHARGWEAGMEWSRIFDAMNRHILAWLDGERFDPTDGQHHLASVAWAALVLMEYERTHPEFDDLFRPSIDGEASVDKA